MLATTMLLAARFRMFVVISEAGIEKFDNSYIRTSCHSSLADFIVDRVAGNHCVGGYFEDSDFPVLVLWQVAE